MFKVEYCNNCVNEKCHMYQRQIPMFVGTPWIIYVCIIYRVTHTRWDFRFDCTEFIMSVYFNLLFSAFVNLSDSKSFRSSLAGVIDQENRALDIDVENLYLTSLGTQCWGRAWGSELFPERWEKEKIQLFKVNH